MDQRHALNPATGHPDIHAGDAGLLARAEEARRLFPKLLSGSPGTAPAVAAEPVRDDPCCDETDEAGRPWPS